MRSYLGRLDRPGRAAIGVVAGGVLAVIGCLVMWAEGGPLGNMLGRTDDWSARVALGVALILVGLGAAMVDVSDRRGWWRWTLVLAVVALAGSLILWVLSVADMSAWTVRMVDSPPPPVRGVFGVPLYVVGSLVAAVFARRVGRASWMG